MIFLSQLKTFMKNFIQRTQRLKLPLLKFLIKFLTERKYQNKQFYHCETNRFLDKSTNYQTYIKSPGKGSITA